MPVEESTFVGAAPAEPKALTALLERGFVPPPVRAFTHVIITGERGDRARTFLQAPEPKALRFLHPIRSLGDLAKELVRISKESNYHDNRRPPKTIKGWKITRTAENTEGKLCITATLLWVPQTNSSETP